MVEEQKQKVEERTEQEAQKADSIEPERVEGLMEKAAVAEETPVEEMVEGQEIVDELTVLRQELAEASAKQCEYLDGWQRARAELANARKRFQREQEQSYAQARADLLARLLPIVDDFERAMKTAPTNPSSLTWIEGVKLIQHKFELLLEQEGVEPIEAADQEFDPSLHQAMTHEPSEEVLEGHVIAEMQRGYRVGDRVLRPSLVRVSSGPPPAPEPELETEPPEGESPPGEQS